MGYISRRKARLQKQLQKIQAILDALYDNLTEMSAKGVGSYGFDSGEGSQRATRRTLKEINDEIFRMEALYDHVVNELFNTGLTDIQLRRKSPWRRNYPWIVWLIPLYKILSIYLIKG